MNSCEICHDNIEGKALKIHCAHLHAEKKCLEKMILIQLFKHCCIDEISLGNGWMPVEQIADYAVFYIRRNTRLRAQVDLDFVKKIRWDIFDQVTCPKCHELIQIQDSKLVKKCSQFVVNLLFERMKICQARETGSDNWLTEAMEFVRQ